MKTVLISVLIFAVYFTNSIPASASSVVETDTFSIFELDINSNNFEDQLKAALDASTELYLRAHFQLKQFDTLLNQSFLERRTSSEFQNIVHPVYKTLMALWEISDSLEDKITSLYKTLLESYDIRITKKGLSGALDKNKPEFMNNKKLKNSLSLIMKSLRKRLTESETHRIALQRLISSLQEVIVEYNSTRMSEDFTPSSFNQYIISDLQEFQSRLNALGDTQDELDFEFNHKMDFLIHDRSAQLPLPLNHNDSNQTNLRPPFFPIDFSPSLLLVSNGTTIYPHSGKSGNITGSRFPQGTWAITFDDGPSSRHSEEIIRNLREFNMTATFFWLTKSLSPNNSIFRFAIENNMLIGNHSRTHANLGKANHASLHQEITESTQFFINQMHYTPQFFRLPYGSGLNNSTVRQMIADNNMIHVFWNVDTLDWQDKNPDSIVQRALKQMALQKRGIILFHDIHNQSKIASRKLMEFIHSNPNWRVKGLDEIVDSINYN